MITNTYFARITFKDAYGTNRDLNNCFASAEDRDKWVQTSLDKYNSTHDNRITDVIIRFGEVTEEYTATKLWHVTPINGTQSTTKLPTNRKASLEI